MLPTVLSVGMRWQADDVSCTGRTPIFEYKRAPPVSALQPAPRRESEPNLQSVDHVSRALTEFAFSEEKEETIPKPVDTTSRRLFMSASVPWDADTERQTRGQSVRDQILQTETSACDVEAQTALTLESNPFMQILFDSAAAYFAKMPDIELVNLYDNEAKKIPAEIRQNYPQLLCSLRDVWEVVKNRAILATLERQLAEENHDTMGQYVLGVCLQTVKEKLEAGDEGELLGPLAQEDNPVFDMASDFFCAELYIHGVISFYFCAKLLKINDGDDAMDCIKECVTEVRHIVKQMMEKEASKDMVTNHIIPLMREMTQFTQDLGGKVECVARCLYQIGLCYGYCGEDQQVANTCESAVTLMQKLKHPPAHCLNFQAHLLNNAGAAYGRMGKDELAIEKFRLAIKAAERAQSKSGEEKVNFIATLRNSEQIALKKLKK